MTSSSSEGRPAPPQRLLLCTDLDRTLIPNGSQPESRGARRLFARLVEQPQVTLAYVSGRDPALVAEAIGRHALPCPAWVVADVGSTILQVSGGRWERDEGWEQAIGADWAGLTAADLLPLLEGVSGLMPQEPQRQARHKLSFYVPLEADAGALERHVASRLERRGLRASVIHSLDEAAGVGLLDVLPVSATKLHAVRHLMTRLGFDQGSTVFAGDSGNDLPVLLSELPSVLVANADPRLIARLEAGQGEGARVYVARGGFMGLNGNYSAGILEGVVHHCPGAAAWLEPAPLGHPKAAGKARRA